jgi:nicotinamidase-related amidase
VSESKVLMVIDVQRMYMEPEPMVTSDGDDLIEKCSGLIHRTREAGVPVVFVQHLSGDQPDDPDLIAVHPELAPAAGEPIVQKRFGSAFFRTDLDAVLKELGAETLYMSGLATFGCVNATVMCAVCKGYETIVVKDAHGAQGFPDSTAAQVIEHFNATWEKAGAQLIGAADVSF